MTQLKGYTAGADIKKGQMLYAETIDQDTNEPLEFAYPLIDGKQPIGIATNDAQKWQDVTVMIQGQISLFMTTTTGIADEKMRAGDAVYMTPDGTIRKVSHERIEWGIAGEDVTKGQDLYFDPVGMVFVPCPDGYPVRGKAARDAAKGTHLPVIISDE